MEKNKFVIIYIIFFISQFLFGTIYIGPLSVRNIMTLVMLFECVKEGYCKIDKYFGIYMVFIAFYVLACGLTGYFEDAVTKCFAYYLVCFVAYQSTKILILKYDAGVALIYTILVVGIVDAILTIGQYFGNSYAFEIFEFFKSKGTSEDTLLLFDKKGTLNGVVMPGLIGGVANGYFLSAMCALAFFQKEANLKIYNIILALFFLVATFMVQERTGAVVGIFITSYLFFKQQIKKVNIGVIFVLIIIGLNVLPFLSDTIFGESSRYSNLSFSDDARSNYWEYVLNYMLINPLGSIYGYEQIYFMPPHNFILNAFVYAGIIGGPILLLLIVIQVKYIIPIVMGRINVSNILPILFGLVYMGYTLNSVTHNASLMTGDSMFWISWAVVICSSRSRGNRTPLRVHGKISK